AFQKGSPLVADVSRAVLQVTEEQMRNISNQFSYEVKDMLASQGSLGEKLSSIVKTFDVYKDRESKPTSPAISPYHDDAGFFSSDEGFSTTEPGTPFHETIQVVESNIETNVHDNVTSASR
nr:hypothetical protein [Tanacetum cinerariifolium]